MTAVSILFRQGTISHAMLFPIDEVIERYAKDEELPPDALLRRYMAENKSDLATANKAFVALKQFLFVCATTKHHCSPSIAIDAMWHEFLMFSGEYYNFCLQRFGMVIHHHPTEMMMNENYRNTRNSALNIFGELDAKFWPNMAASGALCSGGDCSANCGDSGG